MLVAEFSRLIVLEKFNLPSLGLTSDLPEVYVAIMMAMDLSDQSIKTVIIIPDNFVGSVAI